MRSQPGPSRFSSLEPWRAASHTGGEAHTAIQPGYAALDSSIWPAYDPAVVKCVLVLGLLLSVREECSLRCRALDAVRVRLRERSIEDITVVMTTD